ncbi:MAG: hypothetical protein C4318_08920, partial [Acidimicrobiia bacterium]
MRLLEIVISPPAGLGQQLVVEFGPGLSVVVFPDDELREFFSDTLFTTFGGPLPPQTRVRQDTHSGFLRNPASIFAITKPKPSSTRRDNHPPFVSALLDYETSDGRALRVAVDLVGGKLRRTDLDTGEDVGVHGAYVGEKTTFQSFVSFVRVGVPDSKLAASSPAQALRASKKAALQAGAANAVGHIQERAVDAINGHPSREWSPPIPLLSPANRLRALELDAEYRARNLRTLDIELQRLHATAAKKRQVLEQLYQERQKTEYLLLRVKHKRISKRVERIDDLIAQLEKLRSDPPTPAAELALELAPKVEKLIAQLAEARSQLQHVLKKVPSERSEIEALEREFLQVEEELSLLNLAPPIGPELEMVVGKVYQEWRRLSAEAEAAEFAASQAMTDAGELDRDPPEDIQRLSLVTTADKLRSRLRARTAAASEVEAAYRRRQDAKKAVEAQLASLASSSLADAISSTRILHTPIERLASIEAARLAREEAEKTAAMIPWYRPRKKRRATQVLANCRSTEKWLLAEEGVASVDELYEELEKAAVARKAVEPLVSATTEVAHLAARLAEAEEKLSIQAAGISTNNLPSLVDKLEAHQGRVWAAVEIRREAEVASEVARSLKAARDAAATELLARLHPLGIRESDPAMAWSKFRLLAEGWRKKKDLDRRFAELSAKLEPYMELKEQLEEGRARRDDLTRRLKTLLSNIEGCDTGSLEERIATFARLRDSALLERKLSAARSHLTAQLEEVCRGKQAEEWRRELIEIESRLSELEEANPTWKNLEVASPEAVLEERVSGIDLKIRSTESSLSNIESQIEKVSSDLASFDMREVFDRLVEIRKSMKKLDALCQNIRSLRIDADALSASDVAIQEVVGLSESRLVAAGGSTSIASTKSTSSSPTQNRRSLGSKSLDRASGYEDEHGKTGWVDEPHTSLGSAKDPFFAYM